VPEKYGMHEIVVEVDSDGKDKLEGHFFRVLPRLVPVAPPGMAPCALGSLVEVLVNATGAPKSEDILVTAYSPTGRSLKCPIRKVEEGNSAIFKPDEAGIWEIAITYQGRHIQGGPFTCSVFDANGVSVHNLDGAMPGRAHSFEIDARGVGVSGELHVDIVHEKRSLVCSIEKLMENKYQVTFMPRQNGKYRVYIYFNGHDVKGSPYIMRVGTRGRSGKTRSSPLHDSRHRAESPSMHYTTSSTNKTSVRRELYSPQTTGKTSPINDANKYSPQISSKYAHDSNTFRKQNESSYNKNSEILSSTKYDKIITPPTSVDPVPSAKSDYYYNKENELYISKKINRDATLSPPREKSPYTTSTSNLVSNFGNSSSNSARKEYTDTSYLTHIISEQQQRLKTTPSPIHVCYEFVFTNAKLK